MRQPVAGANQHGFLDKLDRLEVWAKQRKIVR
jgi:hypothetical protein